ncbi:hypothetical protein ACLOJK_025864 [Asimina triloba]
MHIPMTSVMAKIYPQALLSKSLSPSSSSSEFMNSERETFTIWMKSLVFNSNGCTVFDSNGDIVYRIDNYNNKCSSEVYLMDLRGRVLFTICRKKLRVFGRWEGYKCNDSMVEEKKPWFQVKKPCRILRRDMPCDVTVSQQQGPSSHYKIVGKAGDLACQIVDQAGRLVAQMTRKQSALGVVLGDDVLSLVVEPNTDNSLIMGLLVVHGLINRRM